jgi:zinc transport system substrate-binding protein
MKRPHHPYIWILAAATVLPLASVAIRRAQIVRTPSPRLAVAATIYPLYDIVRNVAGKEADVQLIVPPGVSPHLFEFSPRQLQALQDVRLIFTIGHGLDDWAAQAARATKDARVFPVDQGIRLRTSRDGAVDPHYWLPLCNARQIAAACEVTLKRTEQQLKTLLRPLEGTPILTFHDAWAYFAANFDLNIAGTIEPSAGGEPTPRYPAELQKKIQSQNIRAVFLEPQFATSRIQSFARDNHVGIAELALLGGVEGRTAYIDLMTFNARVMDHAYAVEDP